MAKYHGKSSVIYVSTTGTSAAVPVVGLMEWSLSRTTDRVESTEFGASNKTYVQGLPDVSGTINGYWDNSEATLYTASTSTDGCKIYIYESSAATTKYFYGPAWLDYSESSSVSDAVKVSLTFAANGNWGRQ
jgi:hypothetical protein